MNLICEEQKYEFHSERSQTEAGVACAIPLKRAVKANIEVKISDRMGPAVACWNSWQEILKLLY